MRTISRVFDSNGQPIRDGIDVRIGEHRRHPSGQVTSSRQDRQRRHRQAGRPVAVPYEFPAHMSGLAARRATREINEKTGKEDSPAAVATGELICAAQAVERPASLRCRAGAPSTSRGLGAENIDLFFNSGLVKTAADIFTLKDRRPAVTKALAERREEQAKLREAAVGQDAQECARLSRTRKL